MSAPLSDPIAAAHAELRTVARKKRRDPEARTLGAIIMLAVKEAQEMVASGANKAEVAASLEQVVREHWPRGRDEPWRYLCDDCSDSGWQVLTCQRDAGTCQRTKPHAPHDYLAPCWCAKGRAIVLKPQRSDVDELASVGKTSRKPSRFGR